jgi:hypothetical protein
MFTSHHCPVCSQALRSQGLTTWMVTPETGEIPEVRLTTEPVALAVCAQEHKSVLIIHDGAYALLFERALQRLVTGNARDAVIDAYTAFEMYLAHVPVRARYDRELGASPRALRSEMESITKLSERTIGAALTAASIAGFCPPPKIDARKTAELRNRAVHAGHYPREDEVEQLCGEIDRVISELESMLGKQDSVNAQHYWSKAIGEDIAESLERHGWKGLPGVQSSFGTVLASDRRPNRSSIGLSETIANYRRDIAEDAVYWRVW